MINKELQKRIFSSIILIPIAIFFIIKGSFLFNFFIIIIFLISSYEWYMMSKKRNYHYIGYFFLIFSFYTVYDLRNNFGDESESLVFFWFWPTINMDGPTLKCGRFFLKKSWNAKEFDVFFQKWSFLTPPRVPNDQNRADSCLAPKGSKT